VLLDRAMYVTRREKTQQKTLGREVMFILSNVVTEKMTTPCNHREEKETQDARWHERLETREKTR